jgi:hypothetical protein
VRTVSQTVRVYCDAVDLSSLVDQFAARLIAAGREHALPNVYRAVRIGALCGAVLGVVLAVALVSIGVLIGKVT